MLRVAVLGRRIAAHPRAAIQHALGPWIGICRSYSALTSSVEPPVSKSSDQPPNEYFKRLQFAISDLSTTPLSIDPIKAGGTQKIHTMETADKIAELFSKILGHVKPEIGKGMQNEYQKLLQVRPLTGACALLLCCELKLAANHHPDLSPAKSLFEEVRGLLPKFISTCSTSSSMSELTLIFWIQPYLLSKQTRNLHKQQPKHFETLKQLNSGTFLARIAHNNQRLPEGVHAALARAVFARGCPETKQTAVTILAVLSLESFAASKPGTVSIGKVADLLHTLIDADRLDPVASQILGRERIDAVWNDQTHSRILELADFTSISQEAKLKPHELRAIINYLELAVHEGLANSPLKGQYLSTQAAVLSHLLTPAHTSTLSLRDLCRLVACTGRTGLSAAHRTLLVAVLFGLLTHAGWHTVVRSTAAAVDAVSRRLRDYRAAVGTKDEVALRAEEFLAVRDGFVGVLRQGKEDGVLGIEEMLPLAKRVIREHACVSDEFRRLGEYVVRGLFSWRNKLTLPELVELQNLIIDLHLLSEGTVLPKHSGKKQNFVVGLEWDTSLSLMAEELEVLIKNHLDLKIKPQHLSPNLSQEAFVRRAFFPAATVDRKSFLVSTRAADGSEINLKEIMPKGFTSLNSSLFSQGIKALSSQAELKNKLEFRSGMGSRTPCHAKLHTSPPTIILVLSESGVRTPLPKPTTLTPEDYKLSTTTSNNNNGAHTRQLLQQQDFECAVYALGLLQTGVRVLQVDERDWSSGGWCVHDPTHKQGADAGR